MIEVIAVILMVTASIGLVVAVVGMALEMVAGLDFGRMAVMGGLFAGLVSLVGLVCCMAAAAVSLVV